MDILWKSADGYVRVVSDIEWRADEDGARSDLELLFRDGAWIVIWRTSGQDGWYFARSRRTPKPSLKRLQHALEDPEVATINAEDSHGRLFDGVDPVLFAQALYAAWGIIAADVIPMKLEFLQLNPDDYDPLRVSAWLRPGIPLHRERRRELRELLEED